MSDPIAGGADDRFDEELAKLLAEADQAAAAEAGGQGADASAPGAAEEDETVATLSPAAEIEALQKLVAERTEDLQRLQAEYINYKKRVDRDRDLARQGGIHAVLKALMPVFDSIVAAEDHNDLTGGFKLTADELIKVVRSFGLDRFGAVGDEFDPNFHEALMQQPVPGDGEMWLKQVLQVGYRINDQVVRPARVVVAVPDGSEAEKEEEN